MLLALKYQVLLQTTPDVERQAIFRVQLRGTREAVPRVHPAVGSRRDVLGGVWRRGLADLHGPAVSFQRATLVSVNPIIAL